MFLHFTLGADITKNIIFPKVPPLFLATALKTPVGALTGRESRQIKSKCKQILSW
jgi:hypothetical protein